MKSVFLGVLLSFLCGCKGNLMRNNIEIITVDFDNIKQINIADGELIELECTDLSLLGSIDKLISLDDTIFIQSKKNIVAFNSNGKYLFNVGAVGRAQDEYLSIKSFYMQQNHISIYDWQSRKILNFGFDGKYVNYINLNDKDVSNQLLPSNIFPLPSGRYIVKNTYRGESDKTPEFSLLDKGFNYIHNFGGLDMKNGADRYDLTLGSDSTLLYNDFFGDTLYRVTPARLDVEKAYYVDFGPHALTESAKKGKDYVDIIQESNSPEFINNIATLIRFCYETPDKVKFIFVFRKGVHYVQYDKKTKETRTFLLADNTDKLKAELFIHYENDGIYITALKNNDIASNPVLIKLHNGIFR